MTEDRRPTGKTSVRAWIRRYPPLITFVVALLIMLVIMPSALNLPQANPTTVLEYAPIPPEDETPPQQEGSLSTLSLGTSDTLATEGEGDIGPIPQPGLGENPIVKRCVGDPPRQTEDPNSPPCVPFFEGENGGRTYTGVTEDEIRVAVYVDTFQTTGGDRNYETTPDAGLICDIDSPPDQPGNTACLNGEGSQDHQNVDIVRSFSKFFNDRFQTYNRHVHFFVYWSGHGSTGTASVRRSDAQDILERIKPFAAIDYTIWGNSEAFIESMVKRRVTIYGSYSMVPNEIYRDNAPFLWSFWPDLEHQVALFHDYVCKRIAPFPVGPTGNSADAGKKRQYGLLSTTDAQYPGQQKFAELMEARLRRGCPNGAEIDIVGEYTYPRNGFETDTHPDEISKAQENVQRMSADGVTTVLWLSGYETAHSKAAQTAGWLPEWVVAGDINNDQAEEGTGQDPNAWRYARIMSNQLREDKHADIPCRQAYREGDPYASDAQTINSCVIYRSFFMLFRGIQVAGPFLTPDAVDEGNHALPRRESSNPFIAACYYDPGDFTCVKDSQESWWDPTAPEANDALGEMGCWRMNEGGVRHTAGNWTQANTAMKNGAGDPCNAAGDFSINQNPFGPAG
jgi:hypothetical protein